MNNYRHSLNFPIINPYRKAEKDDYSREADRIMELVKRLKQARDMGIKVGETAWELGYELAETSRRMNALAEQREAKKVWGNFFKPGSRGK